MIGFVTLIVASFVYWLFYNSVISNAQKHSLVLQKIEMDREDKKNEENLISISNLIEGNRAKLSSYFVSEDEILNFITSIEGVEKFTNTSISLSSINNDINNHINTKVEIKGDWLNVNKALRLIENLPYSLAIDSTNLSIVEGKWNMILNIKVLTIK